MKLSPKYVKKGFNIDWFLVIIFATFFILSISSIYLATPIVTGVKGLVNKQLVWYLSGFVLLGFIIYLGVDIVYQGLNYAYIFLMIALSLLVLDKYISVPFVSIINGSRAWFIFPGIGSFQPSEFMKIVLILMCARIISEHNAEKKESTFAYDLELFKKILIVAIPPLYLMVRQPDTGIPLIIIISIIAMLSVSGIKRIWIYVGATVVFTLFFGFIFIFFTQEQILLDLFGGSYRLTRFYGWLQTEKYIRSFGNQLYEGLLAIGSAGLFGHPLKEVIVWFAEPQNDFIFAVIGQNFGFIGTSFVVILNVILDIKLLSIAYSHDNQRDKLMIVGLLGMLLFQQVENMGMITGLLPITGITLPFISYGGSSLWSYMIPLAIVFKMSSDNIQKKGSYI